MAKAEFDHSPEPITQLLGEGETGQILKLQQAQLRVVDGPDKGLKKIIPPHGLVAGKTPSCNFVLTDPAVSAKHFRVIPADEGYRIQDLGSRNGTWFHGARLSDICLGRKESFKVGKSTLRLELLSSHQEYPLSQSSSFGGMIGGSVPMRQVFALLERAARTDSTLLLEGESGTGKDLAAETVHIFSARKDRPFIVVDCGRMQPDLIESLLFGYRKGAFTGAESDRMGAFEAAKGGTIFLDEIGEIEPALQPRLLRVLEKKEVQRLGETAYRPVDVRLIAATNRDLESEIERGQFRKDLFYRLSVLQVHMPALRDRREDIPAIASAIIGQLKPGMDHREVLSDEVLAVLASHDWPGNVRELRNYIERLLVFPEWAASVEMKSPTGKPRAPAISIDLPFQNARDMFIEHFEEEYVTELLEDSGGVVSHAAQKAKISRQTLYRLIDKYGIAKPTVD